MVPIVVFFAVFLASMLDPIAILLCGGGGFFSRSTLLAAAFGAVAYLLLILIFSIPSMGISAFVGRIAAGAALAMLGYGLRKAIRAMRAAGSQ
ncbi:hypothetical protein [Pseudomonas sp. DG56-2]|uniref:hypothetical protein n=1 Tax=Pseudomonas sp. DG56-2 TaxID=2320270 RepID=UPI0010A67401|nr:hypothetical protein [Pseudomonas sp. DG56-2]